VAAGCPLVSRSDRGRLRRSAEHHPRRRRVEFLDRRRCSLPDVAHIGRILRYRVNHGDITEATAEALTRWACAKSRQHVEVAAIAYWLRSPRPHSDLELVAVRVADGDQAQCDVVVERWKNGPPGRRLTVSSL
jgi:hypothetical protein